MHALLQLSPVMHIDHFWGRFCVCRAQLWGKWGHWLSHHSHWPPPSPIFHIKWIISHSGGTHSLLRDFWESTGVEGLKPSISDWIPGREGRQRWSLGSGRAQLPRESGLPDITTPRTWPRSPVPGYPAGPFSCTAACHLVVRTAKRELIACSRRQNERELALNYTKFICFGGWSVCSV